MAYDMLNISPLSEYEVYVKKFGADDTRQVGVQSGEDCMEVEVQTEAILSSEVWVQWPPEDLKGFGRVKESESEEGLEVSTSVSSVQGELGGQSAVGLVTFLKKSGQVRHDIFFVSL